MGRIVAELAAEHDCKVVVKVTRDDAVPAPMSESMFDVVIDVSSREGIHHAVGIAVAHEVPLLECVTDVDARGKTALKAAESKIPVLHAPNTALGVAILRVALRSIGRLTNSWPVTITETHHAKKVDQPSGTARSLVEDLQISRNDIEDGDVISNRVGEVVGEHEIAFLGKDEKIIIRHQAVDRRVFGHGVLRAARWLSKGRSPGSYSIENTLEGLDDPPVITD
jgi:4-hydroxy-tetrahydrodipicolinate reductase